MLALPEAHDLSRVPLVAETAILLLDLEQVSENGAVVYVLYQ